MKNEIRTICYDEILQVEAYCLKGIVQAFPNHFHDYYVIGFMKAGERYLSCRNKEYTLHKDNIVLFNPGDNHACAQSGNESLHYIAFNISKSTMSNLAEEVTGKGDLPGFAEPVIFDSELSGYLLPLHEMIMNGSEEFEREEFLILMADLLFKRYSKPFESCISESRKEIDNICDFMQKHFAEPISLDTLCKCAGLSKSALMRASIKSKGMTPYRYLQTLRIEEARKLLEKGVSLVDTAILTGFSDQSHFTRFFSMFIGLAPGVYRDIFRSKNSYDENSELQEQL